MSDVGNKIKLSVGALRPGLYVDTLDRPWVETPFLFQGFTIRDDDEIRTLQDYCRFVDVDAERSEAGPAEAARQAAVREQQAAPAAQRPGGIVPAGAGRQGPARERPFGTQRAPDDEHFRELVRAAEVGRGQARSAVDRVMDDIRLGRSVDAQGTREAVEDLVGRVSADASAALWLTNLKNRDEYTSIHCVNVCVFALAFGLHLGLDQAMLTRLGMGALLHDVGKTRTPPELLNKTGPLTEEEFAIIKRHAQDGYELMKATGDVPDEVLEIIRLHHERVDGSGYPLGLHGEDVPLHVRVTGLADAYDAMTSDRSYQSALSADDALHQLYQQARESFGDDLVQEFIRCVGIFPVGSVVQLDNGAVGVVVATRADARLQPTLLLVRSPDGAYYDKRVLLNLAAEAAGDERNSPRRIARALHPSQVEVDVTGIVASEFGLAVSA
ncbi:MAG: HD-GYP domain-containing protein [Halofilum sp. (in: g-proteobacteria)]|nr:HD-GYP domain-containing protein [Halofilum sp. (in: g-proteobacteria)]